MPPSSPRQLAEDSILAEIMLPLKKASCLLPSIKLLDLFDNDPSPLAYQLLQDSFSKFTLQAPIILRKNAYPLPNRLLADIYSRALKQISQVQEISASYDKLMVEHPHETYLKKKGKIKLILRRLIEDILLNQEDSILWQIDKLDPAIPRDRIKKLKNKIDKSIEGAFSRFNKDLTIVTTQGMPESRAKENWKKILRLVIRNELIEIPVANRNLKKPLTSIKPYYWLEKLDPKHRNMAHLKAAHLRWQKDVTTTDSFFVWLEKKENLGEIKKGKQFDYFETILSRKPHKVYFRDGLVVDGDNQPVDTRHFEGKKPTYAAFVLSPAGELLISPHIHHERAHSTLLGGRRVICAGMIKIVDGKIVDLNNESGHYKPKIKHLYAAVNAIPAEIFSQKATITYSTPFAAKLGRKIATANIGFVRRLGEILQTPVSGHKYSRDEFLAKASLLATDTDLHQTSTSIPDEGIVTAEYATPEHKSAGDEIVLRYLSSDGSIYTLPTGQKMQLFSFNPDQHSLAKNEDLHLSYGDVLSLSGDYFADYQSIATANSELEAKKRFVFGFNSLANSNCTLTDEVTNINNKQYAKSPTLNEYLQQFFLVKLLGIKYFEITNNNLDHFYPWSIQAYKTGHEVALEMAARGYQLRQSGKYSEGNNYLQLAYQFNAAACHYLSDSFSAGHMREGLLRKQLTEKFGIIGSLLVNNMHNEDNVLGVNVTNKAGDQWTAYGDNNYGRPTNSINRAIQKKALQSSADEIFYTYQTGHCSRASNVENYLPQIKNDADKNFDHVQYAPLFKLIKNKIYYRAPFNELNPLKANYKELTFFEAFKLTIKLRFNSSVPSFTPTLNRKIRSTQAMVFTNLGSLDEAKLNQGNPNKIKEEVIKQKPEPQKNTYHPEENDTTNTFSSHVLN